MVAIKKPGGGISKMPTANTTTSTSPFSSLQSILSLLSKARLAYKAYNYINPSTQTGSGSGLPTSTGPMVDQGVEEGVGQGAGELTGGLGEGVGEGVGMGTGELTGGIGTGMATGATEGAGAGAGLGSTVLGPVGAILAPIMMAIAGDPSTGRNEPLINRSLTDSWMNDFTNTLKNYSGQDVSSIPDLSKLYQDMIGRSRQGTFGTTQNSGYTREQINNALMQNNPGITGQQLQELGNPSGYDAIDQAYKTFLGRDPGADEYNLRLSTLPGYGTDQKWSTSIEQQLKDIAGSPEAQAYAKQNTNLPSLDSFIANIDKNMNADFIRRGGINLNSMSNPQDIINQGNNGQSLG